MILSRLRKRRVKQILNVIRTRSGRFTDTVCRHDPSEIMVFVTNRCNFKCNTCPFTHESPWSPPDGVPDMTTELFQAIVDTYSGASIMGLVGGEPLLHPDIFEFIEIAANKKMTVNMSTNGSLLNRKRCEMILNCSLEYLNISIDAVNAEEFFRLRGGTAEMYETVKANIQQLTDLRQQSESNLTVNLSFVTDKKNVTRISEFVNLARELKADTVFCQSVLSYQCSSVTTGEDILLETRENKAILEKFQMPSDIQVVLPMLVPGDEHDGCKCVRCIHPFKLLAVDGAGNLSPCCVIPPHSRFGSLKSGMTSWRDGQALQQFRHEMLNDLDASEEICIQCWERYSLKETIS